MVIAIDLRPLMSGRVSGVETYIFQLLDHLFQIDSKNTYLLWLNASKDHREILDRFNHPNIKTVQTRIPNRIANFLFVLFRWPKIDKLVAKKLRTQPDVFFIPDLRPAPVSKRCKKVCVVHDLAFHHFPQFYSLKSKIWYKFINPKKEINESDKIIAVSNFTKEDLRKTFGIEESKIITIHEGVPETFCQTTTDSEIALIRKKYSLPKKYFLFLSTLEPRKNVDTLIRAFQKYRTKGDIDLVIAGKANDSIFSSEKIPQQTNIKLMGFIPENEKEALYKGAEALIYPSLFEGFGLPVLEAMKCGTPVIASNSSSLPEVAGNAAILFSPHSADELAAAMSKVTSQKNELSRQGLEHSQNFTWQKCAKATLDTLTST